MEDEKRQMRVLTVAPSEMCVRLSRQLMPLHVEVIGATHAYEVAHYIHAGGSFEVAILPAALPDAEWWALWGELCLLTPRPSILVYARRATFQLWAGVLESGAYDLITEPFSEEEIQDAVTRALQNFKTNENESEI